MQTNALTIVVIVLNVLFGIFNAALVYHNYINAIHLWGYIHSAIGTFNLTVALFLFLDEVR